MKAEALEHFVSFLYCGRFQNTSWIEHLPSLVYASDKVRSNNLLLPNYMVYQEEINFRILFIVIISIVWNP